MPGVRRGAAADPVPGGAGHLPQDPQPGAPGPRHQDPQRLGVHQEPVQPDVRGERAAAAVAGGPAGAEQAERRGAAAGEGEAAAGAGCPVSGEDTEGGGEHSGNQLFYGENGEGTFCFACFSVFTFLSASRNLNIYFSCILSVHNMEDQKQFVTPKPSLNVTSRLFLLNNDFFFFSKCVIFRKSSCPAATNM